MEDCQEPLPKIALPPEMPVMVLPDCHLFPGCLLPLYIFEVRYRLMLAHALGAHRMFCIGNRTGKDDDEKVCEHTTAGLVRCCVKQEDGTSHLLLLGLQRISITGWVQMTPFRIARIEPVETVPLENAAAQRLKKIALGLFKACGDQADELRAVLGKNDNAEMVCDVLSYHFTRCPKLQQKLLEEPSLEARYRMLIEALDKGRPD